MPLESGVRAEPPSPVQHPSSVWWAYPSHVLGRGRVVAGRPYSVESVPLGREGRARWREGRLRTPRPCGLPVEGWGGGNLRPTSVFGP